MFKTVLATAFAALIAFTIAQPASAGWGNGVSLNGGGNNGTLFNGGGTNGGGNNGTLLNGGCMVTPAGTSRFAIDGIELPAAMR